MPKERVAVRPEGYGFRIDTPERRIGTVIAQEEISAAKAKPRRSIRRIGPVSPAMLIAEMPEPGRLSVLRLSVVRLSVVRLSVVPLSVPQTSTPGTAFVSMTTVRRRAVLSPDLVIPGRQTNATTREEPETVDHGATRRNSDPRRIRGQIATSLRRGGRKQARRRPDRASRHGTCAGPQATGDRRQASFARIGQRSQVPPRGLQTPSEIRFAAPSGPRPTARPGIRRSPRRRLFGPPAAPGPRGRRSGPAHSP